MSEYNNIQDAIENYNLAHANGLVPPQADELIFEYLQDQCSKDIVVFDIETSELIDDAVKISDMSVTVASAQLLRDPMHFLFCDARTQRGAPIRFLASMLDAAEQIIAYNGLRFDLVVLAARDETRGAPDTTVPVTGAGTAAPLSSFVTATPL